MTSAGIAQPPEPANESTFAGVRKIIRELMAAYDAPSIAVAVVRGGRIA
jgi:CubicO group peptidase (beta-lactamase class C family)